MKLTLQTKLKIAQDHVDKKMTIKEVSEKYHMDQPRVKFMITLALGHSFLALLL